MYIKAGTVTVKAKANGVTATCKITVKNPSITLDKTQTVKLGSTVTLKATVVGASQKITWKTSDKTIATVSSKGVISPKKAGKVTISATANGKTAKCVVSIKSSIKLNKSKATIYTSGTKTVQLKATVYGNSKAVTWTSSDKKIATVDTKGKVTAKKAGTVTITAKANGVTAKCKITVCAQKVTSIAGIPSKYPTNGQTCWIIFKEGYRGNRLELTTCNVAEDIQNAYIRWNRSLTLQGCDVVGKYNQYALNSSGTWTQIGTYTRFTDYATSIVASNMDVYDASGKLIMKGIDLKSYPEVPAYSFKSCRGKTYEYANSQFKYGLTFDKATNRVQLGIWNSAGPSPSYEDGEFYVQDGVTKYSMKGWRSGCYYEVVVVPGNNCVYLSLKRRNSSGDYFDVSEIRLVE